jgi:hypothetical protein
MKNLALRLLIALGGTGLMMGGYDNMWWADRQFGKKKRQRAGRGKKGTYGLSLKAHFDKVNFAKTKQEKRRANHA